MILGLCGRPQVGKSEVTRILVEKHDFHLLDSKEILRKMTSLVSGVYSESLKKEEYKASLFQGISNREIMGELGKTLETLFGEDFLVKKALSNSYIHPGKKIVIDSLRRSQGLNFPGKVVEITSNRPYNGRHFDFDQYVRTPIEYHIDNNSGILELEEKIKQMVLDLSSQGK